MITTNKSKDILKIRNYFGEHDKTAFEHWAYSFLDSLAKSVSGEEDNPNKETINSYANKKILEELDWLWTIFDEAKEHGAANVILGRIKEYEKKVLNKKEPISEEGLLKNLHDEIYEAMADNIGNIIIAPTVKKCITASQQYANSKLAAATELLLQAKYQLAALDNQWPTKGTKTIIQEIENFLT